MLALLIGTSLLMQWRGLNYLSGTTLSSDKGLFATVGWVWNQGGIPYRDAWDHKPIGVHLLSAFALQWLSGEPARAIWRLQWIHSLFFPVLVGTLGWLLTRAFLPALLGTLLSGLILYHQSLYIGGHFASEYGASVLAVAAGVLLSAITRHHAGNLTVDQRGERLWFVTGGLCLALATLLKEPFLLDALPLILWAVWQCAADRPHAIRLGLCVLSGALLPYALLGLYFLTQGGLLDWLSTPFYNMAYAREHARMNSEEGWILGRSAGKFWTLIVAPSTPVALLALAGLIGACIPSHIRRTHGFACVIPAWLLTSSLGASLGASLFHHYYMQCVVPYVLLAVSGLWMLQQHVARLPSPAGLAPAVGALLVLGLIYAEFPGITVTPGRSDSLIYHSLRRHQYHMVRRPQEKADEYIVSRSSADDTIWVQCYKSTGMYADVGRRPATKYVFALEHVFINTLGSTREEKLALLARQLQASRPRFLILEDKDLNTLTFLRDANLIPWIQQEYQATPLRRFGAVIWERRNTTP
jgi:hypothetical protein